MEILLNDEEAIEVMRRFLDLYWRRGKSDDIAILLGSLRPLEDGKCADIALWNDWEQAFQSVYNDVHSE